MSKEVEIKLHVYKVIEYAEDIDSIEADLVDVLEDNGFSVQIDDSEVQDN